MKLLICTFARADGTTYDASVSLNDETAGRPEQVERRREQFARAHAPQEMTGWKLVDPTGKANTQMSVGKEEPPTIDNPAGVQHPDATGNVQEQFNQPEPELTPAEEAVELFGEAAGELGTVEATTVGGEAAEDHDPFAGMVETPAADEPPPPKQSRKK